MSVVYFLLMLGLLVTVHELGHFLAARAMGVRVLRFALGFGPALLRARTRSGTELQLGVVPLGGYVRLLGEDPAEAVSDADAPHAFSAKPLWRRVVVVLAGPAANLLLPLVVYFALFARDARLPAAVIGDVLPDGPAAQAGVLAGDRVVAIDGTEIRYWEELEDEIDAHAGRVVRLELERAGKRLYRYVTPERSTLRNRSGAADERGIIGVTQAPATARVGVLDGASPAARAGLRTGDLVMSVDGNPVGGHGDLEAALARGGPRPQVAYLRPRPARVGFADLALLEAGIADVIAPGKTPIGVAAADLFITAVEPGSPAAQAGLLAGDQLVTVDGQPLTHWILLDQTLLAAPGRDFALTWRRGRPGGGVEEHHAVLRQDRRDLTDDYGQPQAHVVFGARTAYRAGAGATVAIEGRTRYAAALAVERTATTIALMTRGMASLISGRAEGDAVGGPIMVYRMATVSGAKGWDSFLLMLALISINLGLINLLPIPTLDGGQLLLLGIEAARRRRLPPRVREGAVLVGLCFIVAMTALALRNDVVKYLLN